MTDPRRAATFFLAADTIAAIRPLAEGNVNHTWLVLLRDGERRVLQRVNPAVFPDPGLVMDNLHLVTGHLHQRLREHRIAGLEVPRILRAGNGADRFVDPGGGLWRLLSWIDSAPTRRTADTPARATAMGRTLGYFHLLLEDLDPDLLGDPLPGFHVTPAYLAEYDRVAARTPPHTGGERFCADRVREFRALATVLRRNRARLRRQVIHGDPKVANFLFAPGSDRVKGLIDLDTVAPGLLLHDLGDLLRSCCNRLGEEPGDPARVGFDADLFSATLAGYASVAGPLLGDADRRLLLTAVRVITFELGLRFFTDHLAGDRYFAVDRPGHNLHRALVQFHLLLSLRSRHDDLDRRCREILH